MSKHVSIELRIEVSDNVTMTILVRKTVINELLLSSELTESKS